MTGKLETSPQHASTHGCCGTAVSKDKVASAAAAKPEVAPAAPVKPGAVPTAGPSGHCDGHAEAGHQKHGEHA